MKNFLKSWLPVILWAAIIFFFSSNPDPYRFLPAGWRSAVPLPTVSDSSLAEWLGQLMHFVEYAVLAFLLSRALYFTRQTKISNDPNSSRIEKVNFFKNFQRTPRVFSGVTASEGWKPEGLRAFLSEKQLFSVLLAMLYALSDEIHQIFVPGRTFQVIDLVIDFLGILFGVFLYTRLKIEPRRKLPPRG